MCVSFQLFSLPIFHSLNPPILLFLRISILYTCISLLFWKDFHCIKHSREMLLHEVQLCWCIDPYFLFLFLLSPFLFISQMAVNSPCHKAQIRFHSVLRCFWKLSFQRLKSAVILLPKCGLCLKSERYISSHLVP